MTVKFAEKKQARVQRLLNDLENCGNTMCDFHDENAKSSCLFKERWDKFVVENCENWI